MLGNCILKKIKMARHLHCVKAIPIILVLAGLPLGTLVLAAVLFSSAAVNRASANEAQEKADSGGQIQIFLIPEEEENAYRAAKREPDPQKRAQKLFEFIQKYPKSAFIQKSDYEETKEIRDEYNAYYTAMQETGIEKRAAMLIEFLQKSPNSALAASVNQEYLHMLEDASQGKKYELLESLAEDWLKLHPHDRQTYAFIAEATLNLGEYQRCSECLEEIYKMQPSSSLAREILTVYRKANNLNKEVEWADRLFKMPEFQDDYMLRYDYVMLFSKSKDIHKAAEYAKLTLESAKIAKPQDPKAQEQLQKVLRACHHIIGVDLMERGNYSDAIFAFEEALKEERYPEGYYMIGQCLERQKEVEKAIDYYAVAELMGGEDASIAKARLELLYKALHNDTLVGIDKVYRKAKELLAEPGDKS